jgi:hypothetical protein
MSETMTTTLGTPISPRWDDAWIAAVEKTEARLGRRCCGSHAPSGRPCELEAEHENGRCPYHGGCPNVGAQPGNTNARTHGLYSRQLRQCSDTCPMWKSCPYARKAVMKLDAPDRPTCPYELDEYERAYDELARGRYDEDDPWEDFQHRTIAMLKTLVNRAERTLAAQNLAEPTAGGLSQKVSAVLEAMIRMARELRLHFKLYMDYVMNKIKWVRPENGGDPNEGADYSDPLAHMTPDDFDAYDESMYQRDLARWQRQHEPGYVHDPASGEPLPNPRPPKREDYFNLIGPKRPLSENPYRNRDNDPPPWPDAPPEFA